MTPTDARQYAPATLRNRDPILDFFKQWFPTQAKILEIASGTGEHGLYFSQQLPEVIWQPSDINPLAIASIEAWQAKQGTPNFLAPLLLNMLAEQWWDFSSSTKAGFQPNVLVSINMIHISPWATALGLFEGAKSLLTTQDLVYIYGPFKQNGQHTSESNLAFDQSLRARNPEWGVRDLEDVITIANDSGFELLKVESMPANNLSVLFQKI